LAKSSDAGIYTYYKPTQYALVLNLKEFAAGFTNPSCKKQFFESCWLFLSHFYKNKN
jgi:hypothetical protein